MWFAVALLAAGVPMDADPAALVPVQSASEGACTIVLAEYNDPDGVRRVQELLNQHRTDCSIRMYSKGEGGCERTLDQVQLDASSARLNCTELPNRGREGHTYLTYTVEHYEMLPELVIFVPLPLNRPAREQVLTGAISDEMLNATLRRRAVELDLKRMQELGRIVASDNTRPTFSCVGWAGIVAATDAVAETPGYGPPGMPTLGNHKCFGDHPDAMCPLFSLSDYKGTRLQPAEPRPLHKWVRAHLPMPDGTDAARSGALCNMLLCLLGAASTTGSNVRARPKAVYEGILAEFNKIDVGSDGEVGNLMERLMQLVYAAPTVPYDANSSDSDKDCFDEATNAECSKSLPWRPIPGCNGSSEQ